LRPEIEARLAALPPLDARNARLRAPRCKVCGAQTRFFDTIDFNKHCSFEDPYLFGAAGICVPYYRCDGCRFLFTDFFADWSAGDFSRFVYNADYIKVDSEYAEVRPVRLVQSIAPLLRGCESVRILDYGSGTGGFAREMRNAGFTRIEDYDPFSHPERPQGQFEVITCFEVLEHTPDPIQAVRDMKSFLAPGGCIVFTQTLQPPDIMTQRGGWWYLAPRNGHICTFAAETLAGMADATGLVFHLGNDPYAFAVPNPSPAVAPVVSAIGAPIAYIRLLAPPAHEGAEGWHAPEELPAGRSRWSRAAELKWPLPPLRKAPCTLRVAVPVVATISADFAKGCRVRAGEQIVPARLEGGELRAEIALGDTPPKTIRVLTPEPISPRARGVADDRLLGLAVQMAQ
jgi:hypothetical protein